MCNLITFSTVFIFNSLSKTVCTNYIPGFGAFDTTDENNDNNMVPDVVVSR